MPKPKATNQPSDDQVRTYMNGMIKFIAERDALNAKISGFRKLAKADGVELKRADNIIKMLDWTTDEIRQAFDVDRRYAELMGMPIGTQLDMFDGPRAEPFDDETKERKKWYGQGRMLGLAGKGGPEEPPDGCPDEFRGAFGDGWEAGQEETQAAFMRIQKEKAAPSAGVTDIGEARAAAKAEKDKPARAPKGEDPLLH